MNIPPSGRFSINLTYPPCTIIQKNMHKTFPILFDYTLLHYICLVFNPACANDLYIYEQTYT